ncbi:MAG: aldolase [Alphaproteobacteria bacterium]|nr:aldolase [Alphaproteobacteria bacterium]
MSVAHSIHASCVAFSKTDKEAKEGVLLLGASGAGKSSLAYNLITTQRAHLVGDDRVHLDMGGDKNATCAAVSPTPALAGLLELRGLGLVRLPYLESVPLALAVELVAREDVPRLATPLYWQERIPLLKLHAFDMNTPTLIKAALLWLASQTNKTGFCDDAIYEM